MYARLRKQGASRINRGLSGATATVAVRMPASATQLSVEDCRAALRSAWSRETSADPRHWSPANPSWGQCAVTALIVQDLFGGSLLRAPLTDGSHYWNQLPNGEEVDLTRDQFPDGMQIQEVAERDREYVLSSPDTEMRYQQLRSAAARVIPELR
jgi:hypothetical protein